jgi:hypothetical protein
MGWDRLEKELGFGYYYGRKAAAGEGRGPGRQPAQVTNLCHQFSGYSWDGGPAGRAGWGLGPGILQKLQNQNPSVIKLIDKRQDG